MYLDAGTYCAKKRKEWREMKVLPSMYMYRVVFGSGFVYRYRVRSRGRGGGLRYEHLGTVMVACIGIYARMMVACTGIYA